MAVEISGKLSTYFLKGKAHHYFQISSEIVCEHVWFRASGNF